MHEIWTSDEKIGTWGGDTPEVGDEIPLTVDGDKYHVKVKRVYKRHNEHTAPTWIIEVADPRSKHFMA